MHSMYSLYRAWLMRDALSMGPCGPLGPGAPGGPGGPPPPISAGAPNVVIQVGPTLTHFSAHRAVLAAHSGYFKAALATEPGPISIPNINVDEFSSLLTFMYTGYLDLNLGNIYNILLATHVLHMPRALDLCRDFLVRNPPSVEPPQHAIIKPIPSRKYPTPQQPHFFQPAGTSLNSSERTPFRPVERPQEGMTSSAVIAIASTSRRTPSPLLNPCDDSSSEPKTIKSERKPRKRTTDDAKGDDKVVIDIACCDGPVRFHRVINNSYGITQPDVEYKAVDSNEAMNKAMNASIRDKKLTQTDENSTQGESFTCVYCKHTFKSQYCYQKHARRHINPVTLEVKDCRHEGSSTGSTTSGGRREVKLLDMNVQYYPCKTCGSKFPSYYFVHKHRKMCHSEEVERAGEKPPPDEKSGDS